MVFYRTFGAVRKLLMVLATKQAYFPWLGQIIFANTDFVM